MQKLEQLLEWGGTKRDIAFRFFGLPASLPSTT